jgi:hypothetical protein
MLSLCASVNHISLTKSKTDIDRQKQQKTKTESDK